MAIFGGNTNAEGLFYLYENIYVDSISFDKDLSLYQETRCSTLSCLGHLENIQWRVSNYTYSLPFGIERSAFSAYFLIGVGGYQRLMLNAKR